MPRHLERLLLKTDESISRAIYCFELQFIAIATIEMCAVRVLNNMDMLTLTFNFNVSFCAVLRLRLMRDMVCILEGMSGEGRGRQTSIRID